MPMRLMKLMSCHVWEETEPKFLILTIWVHMAYSICSFTLLVTRTSNKNGFSSFLGAIWPLGLSHLLGNLYTSCSSLPLFSLPLYIYSQGTNPQTVRTVEIKLAPSIMPEDHSSKPRLQGDRSGWTM